MKDTTQQQQQRQQPIIPLADMSSDVQSKCRRRTRSAAPAEDVVVSASLKKAKAEFSAAVSTAVADLMKEHGYSRERATCALLHEITTSTQTANSNPTDNEVFAIMRQYCIGTEQAARALAVTASLQHASSERGLSVLDVVLELTAKLGRAKSLLAEKTRDHCDLKVARVVAPTSPTETGVPSVVIATTATKNNNSSNNNTEVVRIKSVSQNRSIGASKAGLASIKKTKTAVKIAKATKGKDASNKFGGRKRPAEESSASSSNGVASVAAMEGDIATAVVGRPRSDSVTMAVHAKIAAASAVPTPDVSAGTGTVAGTTPRVKRGRSEEDLTGIATPSPVSKRSRQL